jgi:hypothetical protein
VRRAISCFMEPLRHSSSATEDNKVKFILPNVTGCTPCGCLTNTTNDGSKPAKSPTKQDRVVLTPKTFNGDVIGSNVSHIICYLTQNFRCFPQRSRRISRY